jgi:hypothetical protein
MEDGMCAAGATYITPLPAANYGECDWISVSTHRLVSVLMKEGCVRLPHGCSMSIQVLSWQ